MNKEDKPKKYKRPPRKNEGRPTKLNKKFIDAFKKISKEAQDNFSPEFIAVTDEDLLFLINEELEDKERIDIRTLDRYKAKAKKIDSVHNDENNNDEINEKELMIAEFCQLYKKTLIIQRQFLMKKLSDDDGKSWMRYAWMLERKFSEWNLKHISEMKTDFNITYIAPSYKNVIDIEAENAKVVEAKNRISDKNK